MFPVLQDLERPVGEEIVLEDHAAWKFADLGPQILPAHQAAADEFVVLITLNVAAVSVSIMK